MTTGIYIHVPFCAKACVYCNFYFTTQQNQLEAFVQALCKELMHKASSANVIETIYLGGGTPTMLSVAQLKLIFDTVQKHYIINANAEITIEANPENITTNYIKDLEHYTPINRFSIGIQSFFDEDLVFFNRSHSALQAKNAVDIVTNKYNNVSIDFIYGTPTLSTEHWLQNLKIATTLGIKHLSCYSLTVEEKTALAYHISKSNSIKIDENNNAQQFELLIDFAQKNDWEHYEISNLCKKGYQAKHNSNYWKHTNYLAFGPSAHGYISPNRTKNVSNVKQYIDLISVDMFDKLIDFKETLTRTDQYNEYVLTNIRTNWGINEKHVQEKFGLKYAYYFIQNIVQFLENKQVLIDNNNYLLSKEGMFFADSITSQLFFIEE